MALRYLADTMANGFYGSDAEWQRMELPLLSTDAAFRACAERHNLQLSMNAKDWPERSLHWDNGIQRLIQLYLVDDKLLTFNLWLCASEDRPGARYWKQEFMVEKQPVALFCKDLPRLLEEAFTRVDSWDSKGLVFATTLSGTAAR